MVVYGLQSCSSDEYRELSGGYFYADEGPASKAILSHSPNRFQIYGVITGFDYNEDFIVAMEIPDSLSWSEYRPLKRTSENTGESIYPVDQSKQLALLQTDVYALPMELMVQVLRNDTNYWIIDNSGSNVYGPLMYSDYQTLRRQLHVPEDLNPAR
jgi:hypothetical protein